MSGQQQRLVSKQYMILEHVERYIESWRLKSPGSDDSSSARPNLAWTCSSRCLRSDYVVNDSSEHEVDSQYLNFAIEW